MLLPNARLVGIMEPRNFANRAVEFGQICHEKWEPSDENIEVKGQYDVCHCVNLYGRPALMSLLLFW